MMILAIIKTDGGVKGNVMKNFVPVRGMNVCRMCQCHLTGEADEKLKVWLDVGAENPACYHTGIF